MLAIPFAVALPLLAIWAVFQVLPAAWYFLGGVLLFCLWALVANAALRPKSLIPETDPYNFGEQEIQVFAQHPLYFRHPAEDLWDKSADTILGLAFIGGLVFFALVLGWQVIHWLQTSEWRALPFLLAIEFIGVDTEGAYAPKSWLGLAKATQVVLELPMSIMVPISVLLLASVWKLFVSSGATR